MFKLGLICNIFFDARSFVSQYVRRYGPLDCDPGPREKRALIMFRDEGIPAYDFSGSPPFISRLMKIKEFTSFPPLPDPSRPGSQLVLTFEFVAYLIQQGRPVLGSFPVRLDKDSQGFTEFDKLGDNIYDYWSPTLPCDPNLQPATHLVTFVDYGKAEDRPFLKFVNTHGRTWGADGFGKIFFSSIYQRDDTFCFHVLSFDEPLPSSSPPSHTVISDRFTLPPPPTVQPPFRGWHGIQITEPIYEAVQVRTVKVAKISLSAAVQDREELFSFSGDTEHVDMQSHDEVSQGAYVTSKYAQGAHTLHLPSPAPEHQPRPTASVPPVRTVKVAHVSLSATVQDIKEFFSFSGDITCRSAEW
ncbi:uncharacterized protein LOC119272373 [Triticum dicoccoides]|uniref:uncharacterized protein LOC119272373 n=1 Tax=Triticum dicoccoides TaxID=85692 RepID=UPI000E7C70DA|nr:uncharacterized protein LOC119272373 [Triticum dicoccoides]